MNPVTWNELWTECSRRLGSSIEARHIIEQASGRAGSSWLISLTTPAPEHAVECVFQMVERRRAGKPLQYVLGHWSFRGLDLYVDKRVLIPRPETEQVVTASLEVIADIDVPTVVDLGTGSGAIALSIAAEHASAKVWATDHSPHALEVVEKNLAALHAGVIERVHLAQGSWFQALPSQLARTIDLIVSNPPYVTDNEWRNLDPEVRDWEPPNALVAGVEGLDAIEIIVSEARQWLNSTGALVVEIAPHQAGEVARMAVDAGFQSAHVGTDMAGRQRWILCTNADDAALAKHE